MSAITAKASRKMKKYAVLTREPRCFLGSFDFSWEQRKLGDVVKEITRNDPESEAPIMMITANNGFIEQSERYAFNNAGESLKKYILLKKGELAYNHGASKLRPYGSCFALTTAENARIPFVYHCFSAENQNAEFMSIELNGAEIENQLRKIVSSGARMDGLLNISFDEYTSVSVILPGTEEQDRIADFFRHLDNLITLHQRKCANLCSPSQVVFSLLFATSTFSWEQRKVSELFRVTRGYVLATTQTDTTKTDEKPYPVYSSQTKDKGLMGYYKDYLYEDAITWTTDGANAGTVNYRAGKFYCTNVCGVLLSNEVKANQMIAEALNNVAKGYVSYVGNPKLMNNVMADIVIQIPTQSEERELLSSLFASFDNLITLHQRECISFTGRADRLILTANKKRTTSSWEQRKAKELFVSTADKGYPELPVLSATQDRGMIRRDENSINIFHDKKNEAGYKRVLPGQFVIHLRSFQGGFAHSAIEGITSPAYTVFGFSEPEKHDSEYWKYVFTSKSFIQRLETVTYGIRDGRSISYEEFLTLGFVYPSKAEQTAIARYLDKLSDLITLHQRKPFLMKWRTSDANRNQTNRLVL